MNKQALGNGKVIERRNRILKQELAGMLRHMHHVFMVFGCKRIPILSWVHRQAVGATAHGKRLGRSLPVWMGSSLPCAGIGMMELIKEKKREL